MNIYMASYLYATHMEYWNIGILILKGSFSLITFTNFHIKMCFTKNPMMHFPGTHYSSIPVFQHSNWGEAPKFIK